MKIVAINGSPRGKASNTNVMVSAFLKGAKAGDAETANVFLAEKDIKHCKGCLSCWLNTPGKCVIEDDMTETLSICSGADVLVLATPLYIDNISSMLKVFMERMIVGGNPHMQKAENGESRHVKSGKKAAPKLIMMSNCGFPERSHFQVISHWIQRFALNMKTEVLAEIYTSQGGLLGYTGDEEGLQPIIFKYLGAMEDAGYQIATTMKIEEETKEVLEQKFLSDQVFLKSTNAYFDSVLQKA